MKFKIIFCVLLIEFSASLDQYGDCDFFQRITATSQLTISSPKYPGNYTKGTQCRWVAEAQPGYKISLNCDEVRLTSTLSCLGDNISVSTTEQVNLADAKSFCKPFKIESTSYRMTIALRAGKNSKGGRFRCSIKTTKNNCVCGIKNRGKIGKCN